MRFSSFSVSQSIMCLTYLSLINIIYINRNNCMDKLCSFLRKSSSVTSADEVRLTLAVTGGKHYASLFHVNKYTIKIFALESNNINLSY